LAASIHVGTSGWSYPHWRGDLYPADLPARGWLPFLAERVGTVEVNNSFYRIPRGPVVRSWAEATPDGFLFSYKLWRGMTHFARLRDKRDALAVYLSAIAQCPPRRRAALLVHLPPQFRKDAATLSRLDEFLADLGTAMKSSPWRVAVEFRHPGWYTRDTYRMLDGHGAAVCLHDIRESATAQPNDAAFVYVRRHGPRKYSGGYTTHQLRHDARQIEGWSEQGRAVFAYFNNDLGGHAPRDAMRLQELLGVSAPGTTTTAASPTTRPTRPSQRPLAARKPAAARAGSGVATSGTSSGKRAR